VEYDRPSLNPFYFNFQVATTLLVVNRLYSDPVDSWADSTAIHQLTAKTRHLDSILRKGWSRFAFFHILFVSKDKNCV